MFSFFSSFPRRQLPTCSCPAAQWFAYWVLDYIGQDLFRVMTIPQAQLRRELDEENLKSTNLVGRVRDLRAKLTSAVKKQQRIRTRLENMRSLALALNICWNVGEGAGRVQAYAQRMTAHRANCHAHMPTPLLHTCLRKLRPGEKRSVVRPHKPAFQLVVYKPELPRTT